LFEIKTYVDEAFSKIEDLFFNAGARHITIKMKYQDYLRAEQPILGDFAK